MLFVLITILTVLLLSCSEEKLNRDLLSIESNLSGDEIRLLIDNYEKIIEVYNTEKLYSTEEEAEITNQITELVKNESDELLQNVYIKYSVAYMNAFDIRELDVNAIETRNAWREELDESMKLIYDFLVEHCDYDGEVFELKKE